MMGAMTAINDVRAALTEAARLAKRAERAAKDAGVQAAAALAAFEGAELSSPSPAPAPVPAPAPAPVSPLPPKPPKPVPLFGSSVMPNPGESYPDALSRVDSQFGGIGALRVFYPGLGVPGWPTKAGSSWVRPQVVSFKLLPAAVLGKTYDLALLAFFRAVTTPTIYSYWHEPEDNVAAGEFTAPNYRAAWEHITALQAQAANPKVRSALILMGYSLTKGSGRNWRDYYAPSVDVLGWDCYNTLRDRGAYQTPAEMFGPAKAASEAGGEAVGHLRDRVLHRPRRPLRRGDGAVADRLRRLPAGSRRGVRLLLQLQPGGGPRVGAGLAPRSRSYPARVGGVAHRLLEPVNAGGARTLRGVTTPRALRVETKEHPMTEQAPENVNVDAGDADQVVVNTAPDGGGVNNNEGDDKA